MDDAAAAEFIRRNTMLLAPPLTPEIVLHLAAESLPIWQKTEEELGEMNVPPPYWAFAWAGGQALARFIIDHPDVVAGKAVVDLGAGSGIVAIAAARAGADAVTAFDIDHLSTVAISLNAAANNVSVLVSDQDPLRLEPPTSGVVLVGDLFYERGLAERVLAYIDAAAARGNDILVGDPRRSYFPVPRFRAVSEYAVPVTRELEDNEIKRTTVWRLV
jgi:predicted nicotinamide N-methyase